MRKLYYFLIFLKIRAASKESFLRIDSGIQFNSEKKNL